MKLGTITRGDRKIYMLLTADCPQGGSIVAESRCQGENVVPALVATKDADRGEYVLILPLLYVEQTVMVKVLAADGALVDEATRKIGHLSSAFTAKYNTLSKTPGINDIRNFDRYARGDVSHIEPDRICYFGYEPQNSELVHIVITTHCDDASTYETPFDVVLFDRQGRQMPIRNRAVLSDKLDHPVSHSDFTRRTIHTSFLKEHGNDWFFIWVRFEDDALPPAFICMDKWRTEYIRDRFQKKFNDSGRVPSTRTGSTSRRRSPRWSSTANARPASKSSRCSRLSCPCTRRLSISSRRWPTRYSGRPMASSSSSS